MEHLDDECIDQGQFEAENLVAAHPPRLRHEHKRKIYELCMRSAPSGTIGYSRWAPHPLPARLELQMPQCEMRADVFDYAEPNEPDAKGIWHVNFADPDLFVAYGSGLLAQDELQTLEHPVLGSLREALLAARRSPITDEHDRPTPILITGVERRCVLDTSADLDRPRGLYGNLFARSPFEMVKGALRVLDPSTRTNLIAMAAPVGNGPYTLEQLERILRTAYTAFRAAVRTSQKLWPNTKVQVRTGFWGCGAFGGNRTVMVLLQILAARLAHLDTIRFYTVTQAGALDYEAGRKDYEALIASSDLDEPIATLLRKLEARQYVWGTSDGN